MTVSQELLDKCYGLSLSDQYWILPKGERIAWEAINFLIIPFRGCWKSSVWSWQCI